MYIQTGPQVNHKGKQLSLSDYLSQAVFENRALTSQVGMST